MRLRTPFLWTMIGSLSLAAAMGVFVIIFGSSNSISNKILGTSLLVGAFSMTALGSAIVLDRQRKRMVSWLGIAMSLAALCLWVFMVWAEPWRWTGWGNIDEMFWKIGTTFTILAIWAPHFGLLGLLRLDRKAFRGVRIFTWVMAAGTSLVFMIAFWMEEFDDVVTRLIAVLSMLGACGTLVTPILAFIENTSRKDSAETIDRKVQVQLSCPRCGTNQSIRAGRDQCTQCGLRICIDVEEPRCECGYLLYKLTGENCPECGAAINSASRWQNPDGEPPAEPDVLGEQDPQ